MPQPQIPDTWTRGDILLYYSGSITDELIAWKEGDGPRLKVAHIEIYAGGGQSWASRNGIGVAKYPYRPDGLVIVRRPQLYFDPFNRVDEWFKTIDGAPYGWKDILASVGIHAGGNGVDCSHFAALLMQIAECPQFNTSYPPANLTPDDFKKSTESIQVYPQ
jgi:hypothetical protein